MASFHRTRQRLGHPGRGTQAAIVNIISVHRRRLSAAERYVLVRYDRPVWHGRYVWCARHEPVNRHDPDVPGATSSWRSIIREEDVL